jgi:hypothetical protein
LPVDPPPSNHKQQPEKIMTSLLKKISLTLLAAACLAGTVRAEEPPPFMGSYTGLVETDQKSKWQRHPVLAARVIGRGGNRFEVQLLPELHKRAPLFLTATAESRGDELKFEQDGWNITFTADGAKGTVDEKEGPISFELEKIEEFSPTLGMAPPEGAVVLFDGSNLDQWKHVKRQDEIEPTWKILEDGSMEIVTRRGKNAKGGGDLVTKETFGDVRLHLEFKTPYQPSSGGQGRGNSGLFFQHDYEVQILDSYGEAGLWDECGAMYKVWPPKVNACAPPGEWQTYDVEFRAARFNDAGGLESPPIITVRHNGILIHNQTPLNEVPGFRYADRQAPHQKEPGPISLQDHGNPVRFRNIWVAPLED